MISAIQPSIDTAPKDGSHILIKTVTFGWNSDICQNVATGEKWVEGRWGKDLSGNEKWLEWCGDDKIHTTDSLTPLAWAPTPVIAASPTPVDSRDELIGNLLDRWEMTPNDLKEEMREHGCGKQLDALLASKEQQP